MEFRVKYSAFFPLFLVMYNIQWFWIAILHGKIELMLEFLKVPFLVLHSSYYTLMTCLMMLSVTLLLSTLMILHSKCDQAYDLWQQLVLASELESDLWDTVDCDRKWLLEEKSFFNLMECNSFLNLIWDVKLISISKTTSKKIRTLTCFFRFLKVAWKFLSPNVALYPYKCTIRLCIEYCYHVWATAPSCYLEILDKLQKWICKTVSPSLAASLEPLDHRPNVANLSLLYRYYFQGCSSGLVQLVPLLIFEGGLIVIVIDCMIFWSPFLDVLRMTISTVFFLAQLCSGILCLKNAFLWSMI